MTIKQTGIEFPPLLAATDYSSLFLCSEKIKNITVSSLHIQYILFLTEAQGPKLIIPGGLRVVDTLKLSFELPVFFSVQSMPFHLQREEWRRTVRGAVWSYITCWFLRNFLDL